MNTLKSIAITGMALLSLTGCTEREALEREDYDSKIVKQISHAPGVFYDVWDLDGDGLVDELTMPRYARESTRRVTWLAEGRKRNTLGKVYILPDSTRQKISDMATMQRDIAYDLDQIMFNSDNLKVELKRTMAYADSLKSELEKREK